MFKQMMKQCCGEYGKPDLDKMKQFMEHHDRTSHLDSIGWALFFIWVGVAWLADFGLGIGLLGVAIITLGMQAVRWALKLKIEGFWVLVGARVFHFVFFHESRWKYANFRSVTCDLGVCNRRIYPHDGGLYDVE